MVRAPEQMPAKKAEAHRALEQLEEYHATLSSTNQKELKSAIERVINVFKSSLFQALVDIQEFYEDTLSNESKTVNQKTFETQQIAARWENNPPFGTSTRGLADVPFVDSTPRDYSSGIASRPSTLAYQGHSTTALKSYNNSSLNGSSGDGRYEREEIVLEKGSTGLGFSIAGGSNNPHVGDDPSIYVTKIIPGGAAANDGRLRKDDIIMRVNLTDTVNVQHDVAVEALKRAGNMVSLQIKRRVSDSPGLGAPPPVPLNQSGLSSSGFLPATTPHEQYNSNSNSYNHSAVPPPHVPAFRQSTTPTPTALAPSYTNTLYQNTSTPTANAQIERVELHKDSRGLGFSIAGGVGNEHVAGDTAIYITKIIEHGTAHMDGRVQVGDKLLAVNTIPMDNVTHEFAVDTMKATGSRVTLTIMKNPHPALTRQMLLEQTPAHQVPAPAPFSYTNTGSAQRATTPQHHHQPYEQHLPQRPQSAQQYTNTAHTPVTPVNIMQPEAMQPSRQPRIVNLSKGPSGLGFNIVGGEDGEGIFISYLLPGGVAHLGGQIHQGDQLLEVNGINLRAANHEQAAAALKQSGHNVQLLMQYRPEDYQRFEQRIDALRNQMINEGGMAQPSPRREMFVRALCDYDPARDRDAPGLGQGLAFNHGDILHVTNASDSEWWKAKRLAHDGQELGCGIIPSKYRVERRERARRKQVNFDQGQGTNQSTGSLDARRGSRGQMSFSRKFPFMKSRDQLNIEQEERQEDHVNSYELVEQRTLDYRRPVIILGPLKERVNDSLVSDAANFSSCVPHTSRPPRENEVHGRDYYFMSREKMEADIQQQMFIEAGQFNNNLYGTSLQSVRQVAATNKHCVLDVSANAIKRLQQANLFPVAVFVKPTSWQQLMEWNRQLNEEEAARQFERAVLMEQEFSDSYTAIVHGFTPEEVLSKVRAVIGQQSQPVVWVPSANQQW